MAEDPHMRYVRQFEESEQASVEARAESEKARDYFDGKQFTADEERALKKRKQPITPENLIKPKIEGLCGLERQSRTDPKAWPRTQADDDDATAATDALRYVHDDQDFAVKKSRVFENMLVEGFGAVEVGVQKTSDGIDPKIVRINVDRLYADPHSCEADYSDASYVGYVTWMDFDAAMLRTKKGGKWAGKEDVLNASKTQRTSSTFDTYDDKPRWASWVDTKRNRIRINTHYHLEGGVWNKCVFTLSGELEESAPVAFLDDEGNPECPLIMQAAYVDRDNDRYGIVRDMIPLQDEVNKRRSKFLHMITNAKVRVSRSLETNAESIRKEMAKPDGVIVADPDEVQELGNFNREQGQFQLLMDSRQSLKGVGPNAYMQGKQGEGQSGRAILAQQQAGMTEMTPLLDNLRHFTLRVYRQVWNRIRQYWDGPRWVRITDDEKNIRFVGLNVTQGDLAMQKLGEAVKSQKLPPEQAQQYAQQIAANPQMQQPANKVAELDVDIEIDEVNETPTLQAEQFESLTNLAGTGFFGTPVPPPIVELIIQASNLRDKQKLLDILDQMQEQSQHAPDPMQQAMVEIQVKGAAAQVQNTQADTALKVAKANTEQHKPIIDAMKAGAHAGAASVPGK